MVKALGEVVYFVLNLGVCNKYDQMAQKPYLSVYLHGYFGVYTVLQTR